MTLVTARGELPRVYRNYWSAATELIEVVEQGGATVEGFISRELADGSRVRDANEQHLRGAEICRACLVETFYEAAAEFLEIPMGQIGNLGVEDLAAKFRSVFLSETAPTSVSEATRSQVLSQAKNL